jgi:hypothetical protein
MAYYDYLPQLWTWQPKLKLMPITYAYHVTNVEYTGQVPPNWEFLMSTDADDPSFDGPLFCRGTKCVYFNTTLRNSDLPTMSPYPRESPRNTRYWRVKVPMNHFDDYKIWFLQCRVTDRSNVKQVLLVMARMQDEDFMMSLKETCPEITDDEKKIDLYLQRCQNSEETLPSYFGNDYALDKTYVNIAVLHDFPLNKQCLWDTVTHF